MNQKIEKIKTAVICQGGFRYVGFDPLKLGSSVWDVTVIALKRGAGRPRYPEEIKSAVRDLYRGGMGMAELTNQTGISHGALFAWLRSSAKRKFHAVKVETSLAPVVPLRVVLSSGVSIECGSFEVLKKISEITK